MFQTQGALKPSKSSKTRRAGPFWCTQNSHWVFPTLSVGKESACNAGNTGDMHSIPGLGRSPGEGNGNPLQYSCLENPMDRGSLSGYSPKDHIWLSDYRHTHNRSCEKNRGDWGWVARKEQTGQSLKHPHRSSRSKSTWDLPGAAAPIWGLYTDTQETPCRRINTKLCKLWPHLAQVIHFSGSDVL